MCVCVFSIDNRTLSLNSVDVKSTALDNCQFLACGIIRFSDLMIGKF